MLFIGLAAANIWDDTMSIAPIDGCLLQPFWHFRNNILTYPSYAMFLIKHMTANIPWRLGIEWIQRRVIILPTLCAHTRNHCFLQIIKSLRPSVTKYRDGSTKCKSQRWRHLTKMSPLPEKRILCRTAGLSVSGRKQEERKKERLCESIISVKMMGCVWDTWVSLDGALTSFNMRAHGN